MSPVTHLSFDHPYEPDPTERGLYWAARFVDTYKTFHLRPDNIYLNIDVKRSGETINHTQVCGTADENCPPLQRPENVKGTYTCTSLLPMSFSFLTNPKVNTLANNVGIYWFVFKGVKLYK